MENAKGQEHFIRELALTTGFVHDKVWAMMIRIQIYLTKKRCIRCSLND